MFLATSYVLGPVASVSLLVVKQSSDAELFRGGSVPAGPVAGARGFVPENPIQPVAMFRANGGIYIRCR